MKRQSESCFSFLALILIAGQIRAENETLADRFLGSPLLILAALFIIVLIAFLYHKIRK